MAESVEDVRGSKIRELYQEMKLYNDPQEIEDMKKLIKKNVPFTMRGYFAAYLYIKSRYSAKPASNNDNRKKNERPAAKAQEVNEKAERTEKSENKPERPVIADAVSFYVNVGKASRGPAKDLAQFICENASISEEDILSIVYKQNYSFVYIRKAKADGIIDGVNGKVFKGRKVKVNYSKEKDAE